MKSYSQIHRFLINKLYLILGCPALEFAFFGLSVYISSKRLLEGTQYSLETIFHPLVTAVFAEIILLIIEYRTSWFQKHLSRLKRKNDDSAQIQPVNLSGTQLIGKSVTPLDELPL